MLEAAVAMPWPEDAAARGNLAPSLPSETARLTLAIRAGDPAAFARFYATWFDRAFALARTLTRRDEAFCFDVVQDAMLRVIRALPCLDRQESLDAWMTRVVHTTALDRLRCEHRRVRRERLAAATRAAETRGDGVEQGRGAAHLDLEEQAAWVEARLAEVTAVEKALIQGHFAAGSTFQQLGGSLGMSGHAASGRLRRCVERLRALAREAFHDR